MKIRNKFSQKIPDAKMQQVAVVDCTDVE